MTPLDFLNLLWQDKPEKQHVLLWTLQDKRSHWFQDVRKAAEFAANCNGHDVYVGIGLSRTDHGPARRCTSDEIAGITGFGGDFDLRSAAHGTKPLPATIEDALSIIPASMTPTIVVATGNGAHAWWLFKEPYIFDSEEDRKDVARLVARWHTMLRLNAAARGWAYDRLSDLARILRIPGTQNHKDPAHPKDVTVHSTTDRRYNLSDFEEILDAANIPDLEAQEKAAREWAERFKDTPLVIDLNARIPEDLLQRWMDGSAVGEQTAMKFRNTWLRLRHDLKDQSNSGYDMALADFGVDAGLTEQQIVNLIIHNRAHHGRAQAKRLEYFQRTIAKANYRIGGIDSPLPAQPEPAAASAERAATPGSPEMPRQTGPDAPQGASVAPEEDRAASPAALDSAAKVLLTERISLALGVPIQRLIKIDGKEPQYRMELCDGRKIEFAHVGKLIAQESVRMAIAATVGKIIPKIKAKHWEQISQAMLDACFVEEATEEVEWEGAARMYLQSYLSETNFIPSIEGQRVQDRRKPMLLNRLISICASDFQIYVNKTTFQNLSVKMITGMLSALGARTAKVRGAGKGKSKDQRRWVLPESEFEPDEYKQQGHEGAADVIH
jgi:hypothetical protein